MRKAHDLGHAGGIMNATHIEVSAAVRYWEDADVNGVGSRPPRARALAAA